MIKNREEAGERLAEALSHFAGREDVVVIALPRGGIPVGHVMAKKLELLLDITYPKKVSPPYSPEFAIGAVTETGEGIFHDEVIERIGVPEEYLKEAVERAKATAKGRLKRYRKWIEPVPIEGKTAIIVDDGIATGATMEAAIQSLRQAGADAIVIAVPVGPADTIERLKEEVEEVHCLEIPTAFQAVGQFYEDFHQTSDEEIEALFNNT